MMKKELGLFLLLAVISAITGAINPAFLSFVNLLNMANLIGLFGVFALGEGLVIITGGIDLSLGSMFALLGVVFNLGVYYPLRHRTYLPVIIATIGASILLSNSVLAIYGPQPQVLQGWFDTPGIQLGPVYLDSQYLLIDRKSVV